MHKKLLITLLLALPVMAAQAQSTPAKKALVARILKVQQPGIEGMSRSMAERPAIALMDRAGPVLAERIPADKRDAVAKEIQADVKKYLDDAVPLVTSRAVKLAPTTVGPLLEEKFTEEELKQVAAFLESPAINKFQQLSGEMQKVLLEKVVADTKSVIEPKVVALEQSVTKRLGITAPAAPK
jgi:uncharacterized protein